MRISITNGYRHYGGGSFPRLGTDGGEGQLGEKETYIKL